MSVNPNTPIFEYTATRFVTFRLWIELRKTPDGSISGHFATFNGMRYFNLPDLVKHRTINKRGVLEFVTNVMGPAHENKEHADLVNKITQSLREMRG